MLSLTGSLFWRSGIHLPSLFSNHVVVRADARDQNEDDCDYGQPQPLDDASAG